MLVCNDPDQVTHFSHKSNKSVIIDYVMASKTAARLVEACRTGEDIGSDHLPIIIQLSAKSTIDRHATILYRNLEKCKWEAFSSKLDAEIEPIKDSSLYSQPAIDSRCIEINTAINSALDTACPKQPILRGAFRIHHDTLKLIKEKRRIRKQLQRSDDKLLKTAYNNITGRIRRAIAAEKQEAWRRETEKLNSLKGAQLWRSFKNLSGCGRAPSGVGILEDDKGKVHRGEAEVSAAFANHLESSHRMHEGPEYCEETRIQINKQINENTQLFSPCFPPTKDEQGDEHFLAEPFMPEDVTAALKQFRKKTAPGSDGISFAVLKRATPKLVGVIAQLFTVCFFTGYFPGAWKTATGIMLHKPGKAARKPGSYRPISLLSCIGKLMEKCISTRLNIHLKNAGFYNSTQRAFRDGLEGKSEAKRS